MAFVVTQPCQGCKFTDCVTVCPCESFHEGEEMLFINPNSCIDCEACATECPVEAIYSDQTVPEKWRHFIALNAEGSKRYPVLTERKKR